MKRTHPCLHHGSARCRPRRSWCCEISVLFSRKPSFSARRACWLRDAFFTVGNAYRNAHVHMDRHDTFRTSKRNFQYWMTIVPPWLLSPFKNVCTCAVRAPRQFVSVSLCIGHIEQGRIANFCAPSKVCRDETVIQTQSWTRVIVVVWP